MPALNESPFVVLVDTREQAPYQFAGLRADANEGGGPLKVRTCPCALATGDYSIAGYASVICVERKSAADLAGTLTCGRKRFLKEIERMRDMDYAAVVIESELSDLMPADLRVPELPEHRGAENSTCAEFRSERHATWAVPGREIAEAVTYQLLRTWWRERIEAPAAAARRREREAWRLAATPKEPDTAAARRAATRSGKGGST